MQIYYFITLFVFLYNIEISLSTSSCTFTNVCSGSVGESFSYQDNSVFQALPHSTLFFKFEVIIIIY